MPVGHRTDIDIQLKALALFARGDTIEQISTELSVPVSTLNAIKSRNKDSLALIKDRLIDHEISKSRKILDKAHGLIERKLDRAAKGNEERERAENELRSGSIELEEYQKRVQGLVDVTLTELNSVAREAFNQSQIEAGKPTSISSSPQDAKEDLLRLAEALRAGDEEKMLKLVFDRDVIESEETDEPTISEPIQEETL